MMPSKLRSLFVASLATYILLYCFPYRLFLRSLGFYPKTSMARRLDLVRVSATELQALLEKREITSVELVRQSLNQIRQHNEAGLKLRAVISTAPEDLLLDIATKLDTERSNGRVRGPFHGIPILVKDAYLTHSDLGMPTTVGSFSLLQATTNTSAKVVDTLIENGMIVIGKTNLNEWASWKSMGPMNGWSAVGGQTNSAYVKDGLKKGDGVMGHSNPCGASTGSAVGVSAGFSPLSIGTEVDGSLVQPAARAALYALKPTIGSTELQGVYAVSEDFDSLGAMAKTTRDLAVLTAYLLKESIRSELPSSGFEAFLRKDFDGLKIGFVDPNVWFWPETVQPQEGNSASEMRKGYLAVIDRVKAHHGIAVSPVTLPPASEYMLDGSPATILAIRHVFKENFEHFLGLYSSSDVRSLQDVIRYNEEHAMEELPEEFPEQNRLIDTLENSIDKEKYEEAMSLCRRIARTESVDKAMSDHDLNLIAFPIDSPAPRVAAAAGYPIATVPIGTIAENGRPFGLAIIAKGGREDLLFKFMSAYEHVSEARQIPPQLSSWPADPSL